MTPGCRDKLYEVQPGQAEDTATSVENLCSKNMKSRGSKYVDAAGAGFVRMLPET